MRYCKRLDAKAQKLLDGQDESYLDALLGKLAEPKEPVFFSFTANQVSLDVKAKPQISTKEFRDINKKAMSFFTQVEGSVNSTGGISMPRKSESAARDA